MLLALPSRLPFAFVLALTGAACGGGAAVTPADSGAEDAGLPAPPAIELDLLFVIDNSNSSVGDPDLLQARLEPLLEPLAAAHPSLSVHLGIVTSDLGAGKYVTPSCTEIGGDQGRLQIPPPWDGRTVCDTAHVTDPADLFLSFTLSADGSVDEANFVGSAAEAFDCYRAVGVGGCGFEHVLGSMRAALDGCASPSGCTQPANAGFLRPDAYLGVIILTDEDDCSAPPDSELFDPNQTAPDSELGPLTSYRCFEFGALCGGHDVGRGAGVRDDCVPGNKDPNPLHQLVPVDEFADALKGLKPQSPRMVYVAVFAGPPVPVAVGTDNNGQPDLQPSCIGSLGGVRVFWGAANPGIRLHRFATLFDADRARWYDICDAVSDDALAEIGNDLATALQGD